MGGAITSLGRAGSPPTALNKYFTWLEQLRFDSFTSVYNWRRPHEALNGVCSGDLYTPSNRVCQQPPEPEYRHCDRTIHVTHCGRLRIGRRKINLSSVFAGQIVDTRMVDDQIWLVSFMCCDLGFFDQDEGRIEPAQNPFAPDKLLTM